MVNQPLLRNWPRTQKLPNSVK